MTIAAWRQLHRRESADVRHHEQEQKQTEARKQTQKHSATPSSRTSKSPVKLRMKPPERRKQIVQAATEIISQLGFSGMSLQDVADRAHITEAALYHYIHTKSDLLTMVLDQAYDTPEDDRYTYGHARGVDADGHAVYYYPASCLRQVVFNQRRPQLVQLFAVLNGEALNPNNPAHRFFTDRYQHDWEWIRRFNWVLPDIYLDQNHPQPDPPSAFTFADSRCNDRFRALWMLAMSAMDGIQYRWLSGEISDLVGAWLDFSEELFPPAIWGNYLDPSQYDTEQGCLLPHTAFGTSAPAVGIIGKLGPGDVTAQ
jgi:AcrR family transcriptional regulator